MNIRKTVLSITKTRYLGNYLVIYPSKPLTWSGRFKLQEYEVADKVGCVLDSSKYFNTRRHWKRENMPFLFPNKEKQAMSHHTRLFLQESKELRKKAKDLQSAAGYIRSLEHVIEELLNMTGSSFPELIGHISMNEADKRSMEEDFPGLVFKKKEIV